MNDSSRESINTPCRLFDLLLFAVLAQSVAAMTAVDAVDPVQVVAGPTGRWQSTATRVVAIRTGRCRSNVTAVVAVRVVGDQP